MQWLCLNISDMAIISFKNIDYCCIIHNISKSETINLLENSVLNDRGYTQRNIFLNFSVFKAIFVFFTFFV